MNSPIDLREETNYAKKELFPCEEDKENNNSSLMRRKLLFKEEVEEIVEDGFVLLPSYLREGDDPEIMPFPPIHEIYQNDNIDNGPIEAFYLQFMRLGLCHTLAIYSEETITTLRRFLRRSWIRGCQVCQIKNYLFDRFCKTPIKER